jgi:integrase
MKKIANRIIFRKPKQYFLYNEKVKNFFLSQYEDEAQQHSEEEKRGTRKNYEAVLSKIGFYEDLIGKDLYSFSYNEIKDLLVWYNCKTKKAFDSIKSIIGVYLRWAHAKEFINRPLDLTELIWKSDAAKTVNNFAMDNQYLKDKKEVYYIAQEYCINRQDGILFILPYFGIKGKNLEEIRNLKVEDCDFKHNTLRVHNDKGESREVQMEARAMGLIKEAIEAVEYEKNNGRIDSAPTVTTYKITPSEYVIRYTGNRKDSPDKVDYQVINKRIEKIAAFYGKPYINATNLTMSGILHHLKELEEEKGKLTIEDYKKVREKFGLNPDRYYDTRDLYNSWK